MICLGGILLAGLGGCVKNKAIEPGLSKPLAGNVRFTMLAPGASQVFLVGSFNGWRKDATPLKVIDSSGLWAVEIPLKEGEHTFMYLIDGVRWITPPSADDFVTDDFGHTNGVVIVR
jgi:1,4-alpha-glucan branching enzyme